MTQEQKPFEIKNYSQLSVQAYKSGSAPLVIGHYIDAANDEIWRLQNIVETLECQFKDHLVKAAEPSWTPITSVEQVEGLLDGYYIFNGKNLIFPQLVIKTNDALFCRWKNLAASVFLVNSDEKSFDEAMDFYDSYKLIHAFEKPESTIPTGAIENTLENRRKQQYGYYVFCGDMTDPEYDDQEEPINQILLRDEVSDRWNHFEGWYNSDCIHMDGFKYFKPINKEYFEATLEALAAQERVRELEGK